MCDFFDGPGGLDDFYAFDEVANDGKLFTGEDFETSGDDLFTDESSFDDSDVFSDDSDF